MRKCKGIAFAGVLILGCLLFGCKSKKSDPVTITVIHAWGESTSDHTAMRDIYDGFQKKNPNIQLQLISMPTRGEMLRKVEDMLMVGDIPDVVVFSGCGRNQTYEFMVDNDRALDLMPYLEEDSEFAESVSDVNMEYWVTDENELFTVADVLSLSGGYWYNEQIFRQAGIKEVPGTWEEFWETCRTLKSWSENQGKEIVPLRASPEGYLYFTDHILADFGGNRPSGIQEHEIDAGKEELAYAVDQLKRIYEFSTLENAEYSYLDETSFFNEGKIAMYINGVWGASMISDNISVRYALLPTASGTSLSCESACLGYVLGNSGIEEKEKASVRFLKYMLSEPVQIRILRETEQIPANPQVDLSNYEEEKPRTYQAASLVMGADRKIDIPDILWSMSEKKLFTENIVDVLMGKESEQEFVEHLSKELVQVK